MAGRWTREGAWRTEGRDGSGQLGPAHLRHLGKRRPSLLGGVVTTALCLWEEGLGAGVSPGSDALPRALCS